MGPFTLNKLNDLNNAYFEKQTVPKKMTGGRDYKISVTMTNTGQTVWSSDRYSLALVDSKLLPISFNPFGIGYVDVPHSVPPGSSVTFEINVTAPTTPNYYPVQFSVMESGRPFGNPTPVTDILVR